MLRCLFFVLLCQAVVLTPLDIIVVAFLSQGKYDEAMPLYKESLAIDRKVYGNEHPDVAIDLNNLAMLMWNEDIDREEAARLGKEALEISEKVLGPDHPTTVQYRNDWA